MNLKHIPAKFKSFVNECIAKFTNVTIPTIIKQLILLYFFSADKFNKDVTEKSFHIDVNDYNVIKKDSCNVYTDISCELDMVVFLCNIISHGCYSWIFKIVKLPNDCQIGIYDFTAGIPRQMTMYLCDISIYIFDDGDILEMVVDCTQKIVFFFVHPPKTPKKCIIHMCPFKSLVGTKYCPDKSKKNKFVAGVQFGSIKTCHKGEIKLISSQYIDSKNYLDFV